MAFSNTTFFYLFFLELVEEENKNRMRHTIWKNVFALLLVLVMMAYLSDAAKLPMNSLEQRMNPKPFRHPPGWDELRYKYCR